VIRETSTFAETTNVTGAGVVSKILK